MFPTAIGTMHMRSNAVPPPEVRCFPEYLRAAGYYCTNNAKEDYNLAKPGQVWDVSSRQGHWKNRAKGQPFFAVFNTEKSHESKIRVRLYCWQPDMPLDRGFFRSKIEIALRLRRDLLRLDGPNRASGIRLPHS